jgi:protein-L-isoaspartate(D-aspartate) O-methyltransferase
MAEVGRNSQIAPAYPGLERDRPRIDANDLGSDSRPFAVKIRSRFGSFLLRSLRFFTAAIPDFVRPFSVGYLLFAKRAGGLMVYRETGAPPKPVMSDLDPKTILLLCLLQAVLMGAGNSQQATPSDFAVLRQRLVEQLSGPGRNIENRRVLDAMATVPREEFVPEPLRKFAYLDEPLPTGYYQSISQPYVVAFMTEQLDPKPSDRVLEIGTGSGYQAAVLSQLVAEVYTIEIIEPLAKRAEADLRRLGYLNVKVLTGDGYKGWPEQAPFDSIVVTCAPDHVPQPLIDQLKDDGRMIIPVGTPGDQKLYLLRKHGAKIEQQAVLPVAFVQMTGEAQDR